MDGSGRPEFRDETLPIWDVEGNDKLFDSAVSPPPPFCPAKHFEPSIMEKFSRYLYAKLVGSRIDRRVEELLRFIKLEKKEEAWIGSC